MKTSILIISYNEHINIDKIKKLLANTSNDLYNIIIYDNSNIDEYIKANSEFCLQNSINYESNKENIGLSRAYNYVIDKYKDQSDYIIIFDMDFEYNSDYFDEFLKIKNKDYKIIAPKIRCSYRNEIVFPIKQNDIFISINNGIIIKSDIFNTNKYDENLFLYFVDIKFFKNLKMKYEDVYIMNTELLHEFSEYQEGKSIFNSSFQLKYRDAKIYFKKNFLGLVRYLSSYIILYYFSKIKKILKSIFIKKSYEK